MVRVTMLLQGGRLIGFEAEGHAEYSEHGSDIVCSAVSALTQTAILGLRERLQLPVGVEIDEEEGLYCVLGRDCTDVQLSEASIILDTLLLGLQDIQSGYSKYLSIREREV